jgi:hypothetical protein
MVSMALSLAKTRRLALSLLDLVRLAEREEVADVA